MNTNQWIKASNKLYNFLLRLYPKAYRDEFAPEMQQVFRDECQNRYEKKGGLGILLYWFKVLPDLTYTALVEHVSSPTATWGLMRPVPNQPLPWKGVFLVLLPGFVYLVAQIGQYMGKYWYLPVYYKAALYLMIPVVVVWIFKKQIPIWGLIPLGLLIKLLKTSGNVPLVYVENIAAATKPLQKIINFLLQNWMVIFMALSAILIIYLLWRYKKAYPHTTQYVWWMGALAVLTIGFVIYNLFFTSMLVYDDASMENFWNVFRAQQASVYWIFDEALSIVLLVWIGTLFLKRHGFFSIYLFVGYIMPTMIIGFPWNIDQSINQDLAILIMGIAVIGYRVLLTLVSPVWMARMKSQSERKRAIIIPIAIAVAIHGIMLFNQVFFFPDLVSVTLYSVLNALFTVGIVGLSFMLAISLYSVGEPELMEKSEQKGRSTEIYVYS
jgi:hypothetical protein